MQAEWRHLITPIESSNKMSMEEQITQAVARGWCHPQNAHKEMDADLALAIVAEVVKSLTPVNYPADH